MSQLTLREWLLGNAVQLAGLAWDVFRIGVAMALLATWIYVIFF